MKRILFVVCLIAGITLSSCGDNNEINDIKIKITSSTTIKDKNTYTLTAKIEAGTSIEELEIQLRSAKNSWKSIPLTTQSTKYDLSQDFYVYNGENQFTIRVKDSYNNVETATITVNLGEGEGIPLCENLETKEDYGFKWVMSTESYITYSGNFVRISKQEYNDCKFRKDVKKLYDAGTKLYQITISLWSEGDCLISRKNDIYYLVKMTQPMFVLY